MEDITMTKCPYCGSPSMGSTRYVFRVVDIAELNPYAPHLSAVEIYCSACKRTLSITPIIKPKQ